MDKDVFNAIFKRVSVKLRLHKSDNMIDNINGLELTEAIYEAVGAFNGVAPVTNLSLDEILSHSVTEQLFIRWVSYHVVLTIIADWSHNGQELSIEELTVIDRIDRYQSLLEELKDGLEDKTRQAKIDLKLSSVGKGAIRHRGFSMGSGSGSGNSRISNAMKNCCK